MDINKLSIKCLKNQLLKNDHKNQINPTQDRSMHINSYCLSMVS